MKIITNLNHSIMKTNTGKLDRSVRYALATLICILYLSNVFSESVALIGGIVALFLAATSFFGVCPVYYLLGIDSRKVASQE
ncbi:MAG TPA: DUF2892 domain-containing protein [Bacteroidetes bacterium]|nr:DUF2892 domain-containing protein [Bacteroidota bacterium]